jgi:hypothetical protein
MNDPHIRGLASNGKVKSAATRGPGCSWPGSAPQAGVFSGFQYLTVPLEPFRRLDVELLLIHADGFPVGPFMAEAFASHPKVRTDPLACSR